MYKPRQNKFIYTFFAWYISHIIGKGFKKFEFNEVEFNPQQAVLLLSNHFSWWDGFLMFQLNKLYFKKRFHIMITEENYNNVWFLKYLGCFSVKKGSKSMIETLDFAGKLLNDPYNLVVIFPQGKLFSNHLDRVATQQGILRIIKSSEKKFQYIFSAVFVDYFEHKKPSVNSYLYHWKAGEINSVEMINEAYNAHYQTSLKQQQSITV